MEKIIPVGSWPRMAEQCTRIVKISSRGLTGLDRHEFLEKYAAAHEFVDAFDDGRIKLAKGDVPIHILAVGATEGYGPNRNGDGFCEATCIGQHHTFAKHAHHYRHHRNKDAAKSYGRVKFSAYNKPMRRIEILTVSNEDKAAADRNGGLPMLPETLAKIERGDDVPFSMACKVANDVCSNCGNKAASREQYCTDETCISSDGRRMPGCKYGLTKLGEDGFQQYVENPYADFFDISEVARNADRGCFGWRADYLLKTAAETHVIGGAELAELWTVENGYTLLSPETSETFLKDAAMVALVQKLASIEHRLEQDPCLRHQASALALSPSIQPPVDVSFLGSLGTSKLATGLRALARQKVALPLRDFVSLLVAGDSTKAAALSQDVAPHLAGIYNRLIARSDFRERMASNAYCCSADLAPRRQREQAVKLAATHSLDDRFVQERIARSAIRQLPVPALRVAPELVKTAADGEASENLAVEYALYKLAFLAEWRDSAGLEDLCERAILQNYVVDPNVVG